MKIVFIAPRYHTNQHHWVVTLQRAGHEVQFWVISRDGLEENSGLEPLLLPKAALYRLKKRLLPGLNDKKNGWISLVTYLKTIGSEKPDVVVIRDPALPMSLRAIAAARLSGIPVVLYTQREMFHVKSNIKLYLLQLLRLTAGRASMITPVLGDAAAPAKPLPGWIHLPFVMQPDPEARDSSSAEQWCPDGVRRIIMVGKYLPRKNHLLLIRALEQLQDKYQLQLEIIGGHSTEAYQQVFAEVAAYVQKKRLSWVTLTEPIPYAELQRKMLNFDLYVLPSRDEAVGVSLLEAMGKGLPVVCSTTAGAQYYVEDNGNGKIFISDSLDSLQHCLDTVLSDPSQLAGMGDRSLELVRTVHSPQEFERRFLNLVGNLV